MPSSSEKQAKFMAAACHNKDFAKKAHINQSVACDFNKADAKKGKYMENQDQIDAISVDIPLFIRLLEFAREDASNDLDLHFLAEKAVEMVKERGVLDMNSYDELINGLMTKPKDNTIKEGIINYIKQHAKPRNKRP